MAPAGRSVRTGVLFVAAGAGLILFAGSRLVAELRDDEPRRPAIVAGTDGTPRGKCVDRPCPANADPRLVKGYEVPAVAVDPRDPAHVVVTSNNLVGGRCGWHVTFNGGLDWEDGVFQLPDGYGKCDLDSAGQLPMGNLAMGPSGTLYAVVASATAGAGESILLGRSTDGGRTFSPLQVAVPVVERGTAFVRPQLTVVQGPNGKDRLLLSFWRCAPGRCATAMFAGSDDGGEGFSGAVVVSEPPGGNSPSAPVMTADGSYYMTFLRRYGGGTAEILLARSTDRGARWSAKVIDSQPRVGATPSGQGFYDSVKIATDPAGKVLYLAWADYRDGTPQVHFRRSPDGGTTWTEAIRLNRGQQASSYSPNLGVAPDGRIDVVFYRRRLRNFEDVHWAYSTDGGSSFGPDRQVNDLSINRIIGYASETGDWHVPALASTPQGPVVAWTDTRAGNARTDTQEIYLRRVRLPARRA